MVLEYLKALLLTTLFIVANLLVGAVVYQFASSLTGPSDYYTIEKLAMALSFLAGAAAVLLAANYWFGHRPSGLTLKGLVGLDPDRPLPRIEAPRTLLSDARMWLLLLLPLPITVQLLGGELEVLSRLIFDYPKFYAELMDLLSPKDIWTDTLGAFITLALIGPVCEELLFRGAIMGQLLRVARGWIAVTFFQALLFALAHMNPWQFAYGLPMGFLLGWLRVRTGSLWPPILLHCANNLLAVLLVYFEPQLPGLNTDPHASPEHIPLAYLIPAALICSGVIYGLHVGFRRHAPIDPNANANANRDADVRTPEVAG